MIEVKVHGMVVDKKSGNPVLLLRVPNNQGLLPIWIGPAEANAIAMVLGKRQFERPLTHDLMHHIIGGLEAQVSRIVITSLRDNTFFAKIFLTRDSEIISVDARPSDSVALALRAECPIYLSEDLLESQKGSLLRLEEEDPDQDARESIENLLRDVEKGEPYRGEDEDEES